MFLPPYFVCVFIQTIQETQLGLEVFLKKPRISESELFLSITQAEKNQLNTRVKQKKTYCF